LPSDDNDSASYNFLTFHESRVKIVWYHAYIYLKLIKIIFSHYRCDFRRCGMTLVIPMTSLWSFTMEDQCLDEDETLLADEWETQSEELNFLCNNPGEEGKSILRHLIEFPISFQSFTTPYYV